MKIKFALLFMLTLLLVACGTSTPSTPSLSVAKPDKLHIVRPQFEFDPVLDKTITSQALIQKLYDSIHSLPSVPANGACPAIAGERYQLTFLEKAKTVLDVVADRSGCGSVTITKNDVHQTDSTFWSLLNQVLNDG